MTCLRRQQYKFAWQISIITKSDEMCKITHKKRRLANTERFKTLYRNIVNSLKNNEVGHLLWLYYYYNIIISEIGFL